MHYRETWSRVNFLEINQFIGRGVIGISKVFGKYITRTIRIPRKKRDARKQA